MKSDGLSDDVIDRSNIVILHKVSCETWAYSSKSV